MEDRAQLFRALARNPQRENQNKKDTNSKGILCWSMNCKLSLLIFKRQRQHHHSHFDFFCIHVSIANEKVLRFGSLTNDERGLLIGSQLPSDFLILLIFFAFFLFHSLSPPSFSLCLSRSVFLCQPHLGHVHVTGTLPFFVFF